MKLRVLEIGVGLFMLAGFLALTFLALNVSGLNLTPQEGSYRIFARFENAAGLAARSKVTMSGVVIGKVTSVGLDPKYYQALVEMEIYEGIDYLSADSTASILTSGLLGEKYVGITVGAEEAVLKDGDYITDTQSALVLEDLVGKFLFNKVSN